ncbi:uncharacterized protein EV422DRAFT_496303 [Fimicolochytrium jonesii]|uniref:uncharacterized protein n=1 Tax=Fimicolochytrium jonesii TaxID=1396493 RepID=UPI0022FEB620|nr:uncharacterized protein EV422DRAFT_496303 [Fimicolochytrium jonesii]KAI8821056.1 hypothetical protein EV422DRAFT_496303 [Fimicolochytrium jonesii]
MSYAREGPLGTIYKDFDCVFKAIERHEDLTEEEKSSLCGKLCDWIEQVPVYGFNSSSFDMNVLKHNLASVLQDFAKPRGLISMVEKAYTSEILKRFKPEQVRCGTCKISIKIPGRQKPLEPDFAIPHEKLIVEVLGCFWHRCMKCYKPEDINRRINVSFGELNRRTQWRKQQLESLGWTVEEVWVCDWLAEQKEKGERITTISGIIKMGNAYRSLNNGEFHFKDIKGFLDPSASLDKFIKMYDCKMQKLRFPHGLTGNVSKFVEMNPVYTDIFNEQGVAGLLRTVRVEDVSRDWYTKLSGKDAKAFRRLPESSEGSQTLLELLEIYNNADVVPMCEAIAKHHEYFTELGVDFHKDCLSLPGAACSIIFNGIPTAPTETPEFALWKEEDRDLYFDFYAGAMQGGPSIVFNHYGKVGETTIRGTENKCQSMIGIDCNSLYPFGIAQDMPLGDYTTDRSPNHETVISGIQSDILFGFVKCDIDCPEHLKNYFSEFSPIFHNDDIIGKDGKTSRKLIGTTSGKNLWLSTPLLKWYLNHGLLISNIRTTIFYEQRGRCFEWFVNYFANERRKGDLKKEYALKANNAKLILNSSYGKTITNFEKHLDVKIVSEKQLARQVRKTTYKQLTVLDQMFEMDFTKKSYEQYLPLQIGFMVYGYAKLRMLEFYYDFLDVYVPREKFELHMMDTDSLYMSLAGTELDDLVRPELLDKYEDDKKNWLVTTDFDFRTPGLFKLEWKGLALIALAPKLYYAFGEKAKDHKFSCKGTNKEQNKDMMTYETYKNVYKNKDIKVLKKSKNKKGEEKEKEDIYSVETKNTGL